MKSKIFNYFPVKNILSSIDSDIGRYGLNGTMRRIINKCGIRLEIVNRTRDLEEILKNKPVIVVANHPAEADVLAILAALPKRDDLRLIMNACFVNICKKMDRHIIPVHILSKLASKGEMGNVKILNKISSFPMYTAKEEHQKNIENLLTASRMVYKGGMLIIFPAAGSDDEKWLNGIGYIIKNSDKKSGVYIVKAFIEGTSKWDYLRIVPLVGRLLPKFKVTFDEAVDLSFYWSEDPKVITSNIEADFNDWSRKVRKTTYFLPYKSYAILRSVFFWLMMKNS
jgi:hypothetical protein